MRNVDAITSMLATDLDKWTRRVVRRHFDPEHGSPFWLRRRAELPFDPRDITRYSELEQFGPFPLDALRTTDPGDLVPLAVPRPLAGKVWESGGTTGRPKRIFYTRDMIREREIWRRWADRRLAGFADGARWLNAMPTGPHIAGSVAPSQADAGTALVYGIDMDPRWVKRAIRSGRRELADEYVSHLVEQISDVLASQRIDYLATTPALLQVLCRQAPMLLSGVRGARLSGTQITTPMYREFRRVLGPEFTILRRYGNSIADPGVGVGSEQNDEILPYLINFPYSTMQVVDPGDWQKVLDYGEPGQVRLTVLRDDLFMPNVLERDQAIRWNDDDWPCDVVANVCPLPAAVAAVEGIY
jgi:hypothetical protein